jgi:hypothetical protein
MQHFSVSLSILSRGFSAAGVSVSADCAFW